MNNFIKDLEQIPNKTPQEAFDKLLESSKEMVQDNFSGKIRL